MKKSDLRKESFGEYPYKWRLIHIPTGLYVDCSETKEISTVRKLDKMYELLKKKV